MFFDGILRDSKLLRCFPLGKAMDFPEDEDVAAARRQLSDRVGDEAEFLPVLHLHIGRQIVGFQTRQFHFVERVERQGLGTAGLGRDHRQRRAEEIGARVLDVRDRYKCREFRISLLHRIVDQRRLQDATTEPPAKCRFVRANIPRQPLGSVTRERHHGAILNARFGLMASALFCQQLVNPHGKYLAEAWRKRMATRVWLGSEPWIVGASLPRRSNEATAGGDA